MARHPEAYERALAPLMGHVVDVDAEGRVWRVQSYGRRRRPYRAESGARDGRLFVHATLPDGRRVQIQAHRLVYEVHCGGIPDGKLVRHRNGDRADNRPENLVAGPPWPPEMTNPRKKPGRPA